MKTYPICLPSILVLLLLGIFSSHAISETADTPFGPDFKNLDSAATGEWWTRKATGNKSWTRLVHVQRDEVVAFALYTVDKSVLKMTAQLYPLLPDESRVVRLEVETPSGWQVLSEAHVYDLGWSAHFRFENWDDSENVRYRVRHGEEAVFEGLIRANPRDKDEIVVASLSCNSRRDRGDRAEIVSNILKQDPDMVFFAGDQSYDHSEHTAAWLLWGKQFKELIRNRPVVTIPDDHDIGQGNLWGESGIKADSPAGDSGGYYYPAKYVNMVERCQTWHLPDAYDPTPIERGIGVYYTSYNLGGVDFAIIEDRKFKSGPKGKIPQMGPRPDHVVDPSYDRSSIDLEGLVLLGQRQIDFLENWGTDWTDADMKCVLSQTNFAGAVHLHGSFDNRLLADLDSNGWPQTGRIRALSAIRKAMAFHLAGDQHLAVVTRHGIDDWRDGPVTFVNPAIVNTIYGRWWWPENESAGKNPITSSPLPWTGDYEDGFGNKITMLAYANPDKDLPRTSERRPEANFGDGYGLIRFNNRNQTATFECWPRFANVDDGDAAQYPGWPMTFAMNENDGRAATHYLPTLKFRDLENPVVQVVEESSGTILYTHRVTGKSYRPKVYSGGSYTINIGKGRPDRVSLKGIEALDPDITESLEVASR